MTGCSGKVKDRTLAELKELKLSGTEDTIPTLREVLDLVGGRVPLLVELKETGSDHSISKRVAELLEGYSGEYIVESFSPLAFGEIRARVPDAPCGLLLDKHTAYEKTRTVQYRLLQRCIFNFIARPAFISLNHKTPKLFPVEIIRKLFRTPKIAWTVRSEAEEREAYKNGFSGVIFEGYLPSETENNN